MTIEFKEAVFGKETEITIPRTENCDTCHRFWCKAGNEAGNLFRLSWYGQQEVVQNTPFGRMVNRRACTNLQRYRANY